MIAQRFSWSPAATYTSPSGRGMKIASFTETSLPATFPSSQPTPEPHPTSNETAHTTLERVRMVSPPGVRISRTRDPTSSGRPTLRRPGGRMGLARSSRSWPIHCYSPQVGSSSTG